MDCLGSVGGVRRAGYLGDAHVMACEVAPKAGFRELVPAAGRLPHKGALYVGRTPSLHLYIPMLQRRILQNPAPFISPPQITKVTKEGDRFGFSSPSFSANTAASSF